MRHDPIMSRYAPILILLGSIVGRSWADSCPPWFYETLPRDRDYHYASARGTSVDEARRKAIESFPPGILPFTLTDVEQDDYLRCSDGYHYVLVRIEKIKVAKAIADERKAKRAVADHLDGRLTSVEGDAKDLVRSAARAKEELRKQHDRTESVAMRFAAIEQGVAKSEPADGYVDPDVADMQGRRLDPLVAHSLNRIDAGTYDTGDIAMVITAYRTQKRYRDLAVFCSRILTPGFDLDFKKGLRMFVTQVCIKRNKS